VARWKLLELLKLSAAVNHRVWQLNHWIGALGRLADCMIRAGGVLSIDMD
jgi:hypothetical protein